MAVKMRIRLPLPITALEATQTNVPLANHGNGNKAVTITIRPLSKPPDCLKSKASNRQHGGIRNRNVYNRMANQSC